MLKHDLSDGNIFGVNTSRLIKIFLRLFVADILIMKKPRDSDLEEITSIMSIFCRDLGMVINPLKSSLHN